MYPHSHQFFGKNGKKTMKYGSWGQASVQDLREIALELKTDQSLSFYLNHSPSSELSILNGFKQLPGSKK